MRVKQSNRSIFILLFSVIALLAFPFAWSESLRGRVVAVFSPLWNLIGSAKHADPKEQEIARLKLENQMLQNEIAHLKNVVEITPLFERGTEMIPAKVIFRPLNYWSNSLWIDRGASDNLSFGKEVIAKNSPVVLGKAIVGVIDYVGEHQSKVRLITDSGLNPSVRIKRGSWYLAKGELKGHSEPHLRQNREFLRGFGFNYNFADEEGPARDLRTGEVLERGSKLPTLPLLQINDQLVTTGMDGIFPKGLEIGTVKKIDPLKEGDVAYSLLAEPAVKHINGLSTVFVLPPQRTE